MPLLLLSSCSIPITYILGESGNVDGPEWLSKHSIFQFVLYPFYELKCITYTCEDDIGKFTIDSSFISITENSIYDSFYYKIPFHPHLNQNHYYGYFSILYICHHSNSFQEEAFTFSDWMYEEMEDSYLEFINEEPIYQGACIVLQDMKNIFQDKYPCIIYQSLG